MKLLRFKAYPEMEFDSEGRCDVSTITSKAVDNDGDIVLPEGLDFTTFYEHGSPVNYQHSSLRVGRALWVKAKGEKLIAKTRYDSAPKDWSKDKPWVSDLVFEAVCKGVLGGKSITLLPEEERKPTDAEAAAGAKRVVTKGTVMEFSVCKRPVNPDALVEEIRKSLDAITDGVEEPEDIVASIGRAFEMLG